MTDAHLLMLKGHSFDELYPQLIDKVWALGSRSAPRGMPIRELLGVQFLIKDANQGYCTNKHRKLNKAFGIVERWEYVRGTSTPAMLGFYNPNFLSFLNETTGRFDGAYAPRFARQYRYVLDLLRRDPDTRQAVLNVNSEVDKRESKDVPCTVSLQFFIRDGHLNLITTMRSNDLLWGTPYDVSGFTFIQQCMASWLNVPVGFYLHQAGSLHIYESTWDKLRPVVEQSFEADGYVRQPWTLGFEETTAVLTQALMVEALARAGSPVDITTTLGSLPGCVRADLDIVVRAAGRKRLGSP
jgi:thymidylate synthase